MTIKVISRKIKEPLLPYIHIQRENINNAIQAALRQNKKCIYISGITGYGKTVAVRGFLQNENESKSCWYSLDEWDQDPVTFLNYLYTVFLNQGLLSEALGELFSQPLNAEKHIKNFIGLMCDELENNLKSTVYLVIDNFQEVQSEPVIQQILVFLLHYCPEYLKVILISQQNLPQAFYNFSLKQELSEIKLKELLLRENEAKNLLEQIGKNNTDIYHDLLYTSQKCISLFILLAQNFQDKQSLEQHYEDTLFKNALSQTTSQIFESLNEVEKSFINQTIFLPKIKNNNLKQLFNYDFTAEINNLSENGIIIFNQEEQEYSYNSSFIPVLTESFFALPQEAKEDYLGKIISLNHDEISENFLAILIRAKLYNKIIEFLRNNYEYYFRNYLYDTLERLITPLIEVYPQEGFLTYLKLRLYRSSGRITEAMTLARQLDNSQLSPEIILEEGICEAVAGNFKLSINKLSTLEKDNNLKINDYLSLINCLGINYQHIHQLDTALEYFLKAISLKDKLAYRHDLMKIYHNIGLTYTWMGDFNKAISAYEQSIYLSKQLRVLPFSITFNNLGKIYNLQGDFNKAYHYCLEGLEIANKINSKMDQIPVNLTLAETYCGLKNFYKAQECLNILDELLDKTPNPIFDALLLKQKALIILEEEGQIDKARELIFKAINIRKLSDGDPAFLEYKLELAEISFHAKDYKAVINDLDPVEEGIKQEKHLYHLTRLYVYKALSYFHLQDNKNYGKYKFLAEAIIKENGYGLLAEKLNTPVTDKKNTTDIQVSETSNSLLEEPLKIITFCNLNVFKGTKSISKLDWQGKKTRLLFAYILLNKNGINKDNIFQALFPEGEQTRTALHVLVTRLRKALNTIYDDTDIIQFSEDIYRFNFSINYEWDAARMEYLLNEAKQINDPSEKYGKTAQALQFYKAPFLSGYELENWVFSTQEYYRQLAYKAFNELSDYYYNEKEYEKLLSLSEQFFSIDNCFEDSCRYKMLALVARNQKKEALKQYMVLENSLQKVLNDLPSKEMQIFREKIL
jgi:DNA-binding SARP family transcriptional activator